MACNFAPSGVVPTTASNIPGAWCVAVRALSFSSQEREGTWPRPNLTQRTNHPRRLALAAPG